MINLTTYLVFKKKKVYHNATLSNDKKIPLEVYYLQFCVITSNTLNILEKPFLTL